MHLLLKKLFHLCFVDLCVILLTRGGFLSRFSQSRDVCVQGVPVCPEGYLSREGSLSPGGVVYI